ncbi:MAG TPA: DUF2723 domain-containing protein [Chloroflexia bacterium]|nr:DUF2723 domain-containing protein [Chloroflexia bacterium]
MLQLAFGTHRRITYIAAAALTTIWLAIYASTVSPSVNFIDSGELITALHEPGVAHPPGYPLYTLMGYVISHLLWGEVAWRVNILSAFWGALAVGALFLLIVALFNYLQSKARPPVRKEVPRGRRAKHAPSIPDQDIKQERTFLGQPLSAWLPLATAAAIASLLGASSTFWSRTAQAKMYTLHYFFVTLLFLLALLARWAYEQKDPKGMRRALLALSIGLGLSLSNHLMTTLLVPGLLMMLLLGSNMPERIRTMLRNWYFAIPAIAVPVLLYLYLPFRASQHPLMNWGSTDSWGDFWRHITGWQYRPYVVTDPQERAELIGRLWGYVTGQWSWLTSTVLGLSLVAGILLARTYWPLFVATVITAVATLVFATLYGISEIEPYLVPFYIILLLWLGTAPLTLRRVIEPEKTSAGRTGRNLTGRVVAGVAAFLTLLGLVSALLQYPLQDHSDDYLAGQFAENVFSELPQHSVLITDYWDFYAPTIYLQNVLQKRPDLSLVDMSLLKYPWYLGYLERYSPALVEKSRDIIATFQVEQRRWVNGEPYNLQLLQDSYYSLLTSFVERNFDARQAYVLFQPCGQPASCESNLVAPAFERQRIGLTSRLVRSPVPAGSEPPKEPEYKLAGIATGSRVPMDDFARLNSCRYVEAYAILAQQYGTANKPDHSQMMAAMATTVRQAIPGQCR